MGKSVETVFDLFIGHFVDTGLVNDVHRNLVILARSDAHDGILEGERGGRQLTDKVCHLYRSMDDRLQFPADQERASSGEQENSAGVRAIKDLKSIVCPVNYVKVKLEEAIALCLCPPMHGAPVTRAR